MNIKLNKKVLIPIGIAVAAIFMIVGTFFLCQPFLKAIEEFDNQQAAYNQELILGWDLVRTHDVSWVIGRLIAQGKVSSVIDAMNKSAARNNVLLTLLRPPFTARDEGRIFSRVLFDVQAAGSLKNLGQFLRDVRKMPQGLIDIESFHLLPDNADSGRVTAKITFVLFVAKNNVQK